MKCDQVRELLLTDFLDAQLEERIFIEIENHLQGCAECQEFEKLIHEKAVMPFANEGEQMPPIAVWQNVQATIQAKEYKKQQRVFSLEVIKDSVMSFLDTFRLRKPAFAFVGSLTVVCAIVIALHVGHDTNNAMLESYFDTHVDFLTSLDASMENADEATSVDLETTIEYFFM